MDINLSGADVFLLWHIHDLEDGFGTHQEVKLIGIFSSETKANEAVMHLKSQEGFRDFPLDCFEIHKDKIDQMSWRDGFYTARWTES